MADFKGSDLGRNVKAKRVGNILTLTIDLDADFGPSSSGKSTIVASTGGNKALAGGFNIGVNVYK
jgi:hypothetical protein